MSTQLRPVDVLVILALLASVIVLVGAGTSRAVLPPTPGPMTVSEASSLFIDEPVLVRGYLVRKGGRVLLCDQPFCYGPTLVVRGLGQPPARGRVVVAGHVHGDRIVPLKLAPRRSGHV
jgi:hypothetical protein